jgi:hypothetical protein
VPYRVAAAGPLITSMLSMLSGWMSLMGEGCPGRRPPSPRRDRVSPADPDAVDVDQGGAPQRDAGHPPDPGDPTGPHLAPGGHDPHPGDLGAEHLLNIGGGTHLLHLGGVQPPHRIAEGPGLGASSDPGHGDGIQGQGLLGHPEHQVHPTHLHGLGHLPVAQRHDAEGDLVTAQVRSGRTGPGHRQGCRSRCPAPRPGPQPGDARGGVHHLSTHLLGPKASTPRKRMTPRRATSPIALLTERGTAGPDDRSGGVRPTLEGSHGQLLRLGGCPPAAGTR